METSRDKTFEIPRIISINHIDNQIFKMFTKIVLFSEHLGIYRLQKLQLLDEKYILW
jgi:hypothetical protein